MDPLDRVIGVRGMETGAVVMALHTSQRAAAIYQCNIGFLAEQPCNWCFIQASAISSDCTISADALRAALCDGSVVTPDDPTALLVLLLFDCALHVQCDS